MGQSYKICVTGGPCGGKTTILSALEGYIIVPETASMLTSQGIFPKDRLLYQQKLLAVQFAKEEMFEALSSGVLFCDRGAADSYAFVNKYEFGILGGEALLKRYDAIIFVKSCANIGLYDENNISRKKSSEQALEIENKLFEIWSRHPNFYVIEANEDFQEKQKEFFRVVEEILNKEGLGN